MTQLIPKTHMLRSKRKRRWNVAEALAELIDNGFSEGKGNADTIRIDIGPKALKVWDNGIGVDNINRLFTFGDSSTADLAGEIGQYGVGATDCAVWMAPVQEVITIRDGRVHHHKVDWAKVEASGAWPQSYDGKGVRFSSSNAPVELARAGHGTMVIMHHPTRFGSGFKFDRVLDKLGHIFGPGLRAGKTLEVRYRPRQQRSAARKWTRVAAYSPPKLDAEILISGVVTLDDGTELAWTGRAGVSDELTITHNAVHIGYQHRIIESTQEPFAGLSVPTLYAEVDLGAEWKYALSDHKDAVVDHRDELMGTIEQALADLLDTASQESKSLRNTEIALLLEDMLAGVFSARPQPDGSSTVTETHEREGDEQGHEHGDEDGDEAPGEHDEDGAGEQDDPTAKDGTGRPFGIQINWLSSDQMEGRLSQVEVSSDTVTVFLDEDHPLLEDARHAPTNTPVLITTVVHSIAIEFAHLLEQGRDLSAIMPRLADTIEEGEPTNLMAYKLASMLGAASSPTRKRAAA